MLSKSAQRAQRFFVSDFFNVVFTSERLLLKEKKMRRKEDLLFWLLVLLAGEPGGHQARQQEEDRADPTSPAGTQTRELSRSVALVLGVPSNRTRLFTFSSEAFNHWEIFLFKQKPTKEYRSEHCVWSRRLAGPFTLQAQNLTNLRPKQAELDWFRVLEGGFKHRSFNAGVEPCGSDDRGWFVEGFECWTPERVVTEN